MRDEKQLVVLDEIERARDRITGQGRTAAGARVEFPIDEAMLLGIVRMIALTEGASVWVPSSLLRAISDGTRATRDDPPAAGRPDDLLPTSVAWAQRRGYRGRTVLIVLPEQLVSSLVGARLVEAGFDVRFAPASTAEEWFGVGGPPDAVVLDVAHGDGPSGPALASALAARAEELGVVYLTRLPDARFVGTEIPLGRRIAFLRHDSTPDPERLVDAVDAVIDRRSSRSFRDDLHPDRPLGMLSNRQLWLLSQLARGLLLADIAGARGVSERGAQRLLSRTYARLGITARKSGHARSLAVRKYCEAAGMAPVTPLEAIPG